MTRVRKNSEKRKAKSRDAARVRRSTESDIFSEISSLLPITCSQSMDKISIVRMAAAYLKTAGCLSENWNDWKVHDVGWDGSEVGIAVEGIPILVAADGSIAFVSEASDTLLGLNPLDLMGNLLYDYVHLCDHQELDSLLTPSGSGFKNKFIRLKTTLTSRGKRVNLSQATYRVLRCSGKYLPNGMILALMETLPNACSIIDRFLGRQVILSKHSLDMRFTQIDKSLCESIFGFTESDIVGTSFYQYFHPLDAPVVESSLRDLYAKGQVETPAYRFLAKDGSCIWIVSQWTLVRDSASASHDQHLGVNSLRSVTGCPLQQQNSHNNHNNNAPNVQHHFNQSQSNYILSIHYVISTERSTAATATSSGTGIDCGATTRSSESEEADRLACDIRLLLSDTDSDAVVSQLTPVTASSSSSAAPLPPDSSLQGTLASQLLLSSTTKTEATATSAASFLSSAAAAVPVVEKITATDSVFAPRTEDMSSGFLMLTGDDKSPLTIIHDSVIETDPAHDLTHLAPEVGDSDFPLDLDNIPFDGFDMDELLELSARSDAAVVPDSRPLASATSTPDSLTPTTAGVTDSAFCGSSDAGSSPFSFDSRCSPADDFGHRHLQDVMSGGSANCSPFSLESDSSDQFKSQDDERNVSVDGAFPFSLESLVSDVVVSSPGEEDPDIMMMPFCRSSSIGDSPPSSSRSFDCDSDLDLYSNCNTDLGLFTDDTFLDSLLTSNLPDVISNAADDLISSLHHCNDSTTAATNSGLQMNSHTNSSSGNNRDFFLPSLCSSKLPPPLPLTSSLATLLQQKTIMSGSTSNNTSNAIRASSISATGSSSGSCSKASLKSTGHGNSTHATNSHILVQNGQHFTIYKILAATPSSSTTAGSGVAASPASITSQKDVGTSHKGVAKRFLTGVSSQLPPNKRIHIDSGSFSVQHPKPVNGNSVLMNLLVNGEDVRNGYTSRKSNAAPSSRSGTTTYSCPFD